MANTNDEIKVTCYFKDMVSGKTVVDFGDIPASVFVRTILAAGLNNNFEVVAHKTWDDIMAEAREKMEEEKESDDEGVQ